MILKLELIEQNMEIFHHVFDECIVRDEYGNLLSCHTVSTEGKNEVIISDVVNYEAKRGSITVYRKLFDLPIDIRRRKIRRMADSLGAVI